MNLTPSGSVAEIYERAQDYARAVIAPGRTAREARKEIEHEIVRGLAERGLLGVNVSAAYGGAAAGVVAYAHAVRAVAGADAAVAVTMAVSNMVAEVLSEFGSDRVRNELIPQITGGECIGGAFALSEAGAGSDPAGMTTRATRTDDGAWSISGEKLWITTGDQAGPVVVWARTGDGHKGISAFAVPGNTAGLRAGPPEEKMGLRASHTVALSLDEVRVPEDALLGKEGEGFRIAMMALDGGRIGIGSQALGIGGALVAAVRARNREPWTESALADVRTRLEASWALTLRAASLKEEKKPFSKEAAMAKLYASESANWIARRVSELMGADGVEDDSVASRYLRDCRVTQVYEGTSEIQRIVISRQVMAGV